MITLSSVCAASIFLNNLKETNHIFLVLGILSVSHESAYLLAKCDPVHVHHELHTDSQACTCTYRSNI